ADRLGQLGLVPPVVELRHGFIVSEWLEGERAWRPQSPFPREPLLDAVARYLVALAQRFPAPAARRGASISKLLEMARPTSARAGISVAAVPAPVLRRRLPRLPGRSPHGRDGVAARRSTRAGSAARGDARLFGAAAPPARGMSISGLVLGA